MCELQSDINGTFIVFTLVCNGGRVSYGENDVHIQKVCNPHILIHVHIHIRVHIQILRDLRSSHTRHRHQHRGWGQTQRGQPHQQISCRSSLKPRTVNSHSGPAFLYSTVSVRSVVSSVSSPTSTIAVVAIPGVSGSIGVRAGCRGVIWLGGGQGQGEGGCDLNTPARNGSDDNIQCFDLRREVTS